MGPSVLKDQRVSPAAHRMMARSAVRGGDILMTITGYIGRSCLYPLNAPEANINQHIARIRVADLGRVEPRFVTWAMQDRRQRARLERDLTGLAYPQISLAQVQAIPLPLPPLPEQRQIAAILDTIDDAIRKTEQIIAKLKQVKQGLLHDLLTRGIDDNGELRDPERHPEQFKDSPLGRIPTQWDVVPISQLGELATGRTPPAVDPQAWGTKLPFITPAEVTSDGNVLDPTRRLSDRGARYVRELPESAVLVVCIGSTLGKVALAPWRCATNQQINAIACSESHNPVFVCASVHQHVAQLHRWAGLQAVPIINKTQFGRMLVPSTSRAEQREIGQRILSVGMRLRNEGATRDKLNLVKQGLMEDLLTGSVRVTNLLENPAP